MNPEAKRAWLEALRSGNYKQGRLRLRSRAGNNTVFCCLGVACDIAPADIVRWNEATCRYQYRTERADGWLTWDHEDLPPPVRDWLGIETGDPIVSIVDLVVDGVDRECTLAMLNDGTAPEHSGPMPFAEIADVIEAHL